MKPHAILHVGRFASVTHKRIGNMWHVMHRVTSDDTWWRGYMLYRIRS